MRRLLALVTLTVLAALVPAVTLAPAGTSAAAVEGSCGTDTIVILFWPRGHAAIPRIRFPEVRAPHIEVYSYAAAATYQGRYFLAYADGKGKSSLKPGCTRVQDHGTVQQLPATSITRAAAVTCRTRGETLVQVRKIAGAGVRREVRLLEAPNRLVLRALVTGNAIGSNLAYNTQRCRAGAPPG